jgi:hypothetical protein
MGLLAREDAAVKMRKYNTKSAKINATEVMELRQLAAEGMTHRELGDRYNLSAVQVGRIVRGESRRDLPTVKSEHELEMEMQESLQRFKQENPDLVPIVVPTEGSPIMDKLLTDINEAAKPSKDLDGLLTPELRERAKGYGAR